MEMFLTILFTSLLVLAFCAVAFGRPRPEAKTPAGGPARAEARPRAAARSSPASRRRRRPRRAQFPVETLLSQIERHVRLEQAAAETFLDVPTPRGAPLPDDVAPFLN